MRRLVVSITEGHNRLSLLNLDFCFLVFYMKVHLLQEAI